MYGRVRICALSMVAVLAVPRGSVAAVCGDIPNVLIVLDRSASMTTKVDGVSKWNHATTAVNSLTTTFAGRIAFGLMLFASDDNCAAGTLNVGCAVNTEQAIATAMQSTYPSSLTPIGATLEVALTYMKTLGTAVPRYVIVITDGSETCSGKPVDAATELKIEGINTYVVGFGSGVSATTLGNIAVAGGTGSYYQADDLPQLEGALQQIAADLSCCGNGVIDVGETCDIAIPAGSPGYCPTCNDKDPCTADTKLGIACDVSCSHVPITQPQNGDNCCPPGATVATDNDCQPACGDGVLDASEKCDTQIAAGLVGACPSSCDDGNACTADALVGTDCDVRCTTTQITQEINGDGCCPRTASYATDDDCPVLCGNGVLDAGELCDTQIAAGQPGACPASCADDGLVCTRDVLSVNGCETKCVHPEITLPIDGDGCCPAGADNVSDGDCPSICGNGVVEKGELCDTGIAAGAAGACPQSCEDENPCTDDSITGTDCQARCAHDTVAPSLTAPDECCPPGNTDRTDVDCLPPCSPDRTQNCIDLCAGVACKDGEYCEGGKCTPWPDSTHTETDGGTGPVAGDAQGGGGDAGVAGGDAGPGGDAGGGGEGEGPFESSSCGCAAGEVGGGALPTALLVLGLLAGLLVARRRH